MNRRLLFLGLVVALLLPASAVAVWGGQVDSAHPQVGAMYFDFEGNGEPVIDGGICSGSFAGESKDGRHDVFLTAGHCMPPPELGIEPGDLYVSFSSNASAGSTSDPVEDPIQVEAYYQMPGFGHDFGDPHDLGVLLLPDDSVPGSIMPVSLAPAGYLDSLRGAGNAEVPERGRGRVRGGSGLGLIRPDDVLVRREASIRHARRHRADQVVPALQREPERDRGAARGCASVTPALRNSLRGRSWSFP